MNLLQAEFKSLKIHTPEAEKEYLVTNCDDDFAVAYYCCGFWVVYNIEAMSGFAGVELSFEPTHFAEIKTGETK